MKKPGRKLTIDRQTIRELQDNTLAAPRGGYAQVQPLHNGCSYRPTGCSTYEDSRCCDF